MVKIPSPEEQQPRIFSGRRIGQTSFRPFWSPSRLLHLVELTQPLEPKSLKELEAQAFTIAKAKENYSAEYPTKTNFFKVMECLRMLYNLNFMIICEQCGGIHNNLNDELFAPER